MKILLIEDDSTTVKAIQLCLEIHFPEVKVVASAKGLDGIKLFSTEAPDLVIIDLGLEDIDGMEVLRQIRQSSNVPILIVSARFEPESIAKGKELGADDYIVKPFTHKDFLARLYNALYRHREC